MARRYLYMNHDLPSPWFSAQDKTINRTLAKLSSDDQEFSHCSEEASPLEMIHRRHMDSVSQLVRNSILSSLKCTTSNSVA